MSFVYAPRYSWIWSGQHHTHAVRKAPNLNYPPLQYRRCPTTPLRDVPNQPGCQDPSCIVVSTSSCWRHGRGTWHESAKRIEDIMHFKLSATTLRQPLPEVV